MHDLQFLTVLTILAVGFLGILAAAFHNDDEDDLNDE